jgi:hypothetical protein
MMRRVRGGAFHRVFFVTDRFVQHELTAQARLSGPQVPGRVVVEAPGLASRDLLTARTWDGAP